MHRRIKKVDDWSQSAKIQAALFDPDSREFERMAFVMSRTADWMDKNYGIPEHTTKFLHLCCKANELLSFCVMLYLSDSGPFGILDHGLQHYEGAKFCAETGISYDKVMGYVRNRAVKEFLSDTERVPAEKLIQWATGEIADPTKADIKAVAESLDIDFFNMPQKVIDRARESKFIPAEAGEMKQPDPEKKKQKTNQTQDLRASTAEITTENNSQRPEENANLGSKRKKTGSWLTTLA